MNTNENRIAKAIDHNKNYYSDPCNFCNMHDPRYRDNENIQDYCHYHCKATALVIEDTNGRIKVEVNHHV